MKIAICDDDIVYIKEIERTIKNILIDKKLTAEFFLFSESRNIMNSDEFYDIAFLDVEMPNHNGINIAKKLKETNPYIVIFIITSYEKYLDDAMDLNVFRYIKKPLDPYRLKRGLEKAIENIDNNTITFFLKQGKSVQSVSSNDIILVEIQGRSTKVVTTNETYISEKKIDYWKEKLIAVYFYQVHKSFIINMKHITNYTRDTLILDYRYSVPIAYREQARFRSFFLNYFGGH